MIPLSYSLQINYLVERFVYDVFYLYNIDNK